MTFTGTGTVSRLLISLGLHPFFLAVPRTPEGFYRTTGGLQVAVDRALAYAPYADLLWLETGKPDLAEARSFARRIREKYPGKWFVYNLSPSFNWAKAGFSGTSHLTKYRSLADSTNDLCRFRSQEFYLGTWERRVRRVAFCCESNHLIDEPRFVLQLISLAGLHSNAAATGTFPAEC